MFNVLHHHSNNMVHQNQKEMEATEEKYPNSLMLCHYCGTMFRGERGLAIHLSKNSGDELHPHDVSIDDGNYTEIPADADWNPVIDHSEISVLHEEIVREGENLKGREGGRSGTIRENFENITIPEGVNKVKKVAAVIDQLPELYNRRRAVQNLINCSTTTFYEGRNLFDDGYSFEGREGSEERVDAPNEIVWGDGKNSVRINGEKYISVERFKEIMILVNKANENIQRVSTEGAMLIHRA